MRQKDVMFAELRRQEIADLVREQKKTTVTELCDHFSVSPATIRNDLTDLEQRGLLQRTHGGAISIVHTASYEPTSHEKEIQNVAAKRAIAQAALKLVHAGDVIALDSGTTTLEFAKQLCTLSGLTIITNDLKIALYLEQNSSHTIVLIGGIVRKNFHCTIGGSVQETLEFMHIDRLFVATNGINPDRGLSTPSLEMANIKRMMISISSEVILLADSSKLNKNSFAYFARLDQIGTMVTDSHLEHAFRERAESTGVRVIVAAKDEAIAEV